MKRNLTLGIVFISAVALSSCSTQNKLAAVKTDDDVYFTKAKAGEEPVYTASVENKDSYRYSNSNNNSDYYYYDSYEARLNRFYGFSPYGASYYSDVFYGGYSPYSSGLSIGLGIGSFGYGYSPYSYSPFGYSPYYSYSPFGYSPYGFDGYNYGYNGYGGIYSYYNTVPGYAAPSRPYRGSGLPGSSVGYSGSGYTGYGSAGSYPPASRPSRTSINTMPSNNGQPVNQNPNYRPTAVQPQYQPQQQNYNPPPSNSGSSSSGSSSSGGRPVRP